MQNNIPGFKADYEVEAGNTNLILTKDNLNNQEIIKFQVEMINNNQIPGVLNLNLRLKDLDYKFYYDVTGKVTLANYLRRQKLQKHQFINLMDSILKTILESKNYFLDHNSFILDENYMYLDTKSLHVELIYIPVDLNQNIIPVFKNFLTDLIINSASLEVADNFLQGILRLARREEINLLELRNQLQRMKNNPVDEGKNDDAHDVKELKDLKDLKDLYEFNNDNPINDNHNNPSLNQNRPLYEGISHNSESIFSFEDDFSIKPSGKLNLKDKLNIPFNTAKFNTNFPLRKLLLAILAVISVITALMSTQDGGLAGVAQKINGLKFILLGGGLIIFGLGIIFFILIKPKQTNDNRQLVRYNDSLTELDNPTPRLANPLLFKNNVVDSIAASTPEGSQNEYTQFSAQVNLEDFKFNSNPNLSQDYNHGLACHRDETVFLSDLKVPMLKGVNGGEIIIINQPEFIIGRNGEACNYYLQEPSLGRAHVKLQIREDGIYVTDLDSKNGTFINGQRLISNKAYLLENNAKLKLANLEFLLQG